MNLPPKKKRKTKIGSDLLFMMEVGEGEEFVYIIIVYACIHMNTYSRLAVIHARKELMIQYKLCGLTKQFDFEIPESK